MGWRDISTINVVYIKRVIERGERTLFLHGGGGDLAA